MPFAVQFVQAYAHRTAPILVDGAERLLLCSSEADVSKGEAHLRPAHLARAADVGKREAPWPGLGACG